MNATATRRAALPLTDAQRAVLRELRSERTTDQVATRTGLSRDGARAVLMALASKGRVRHYPGRPAADCNGPRD